jgi:hypothetical protein
MGKQKNNNMFLCGVCGNPLIKSKKYPRIKCIYCGQYTEVPGFENRNQKERCKDDNGKL